MTTKLLLFLAFASYALYANARDIPRASVDFEDTSYEDAKNDKEGTYAIKNDEDHNQLTARGILHRMKNTVNKVKQTAKDMFTARGLLDKVSSTVNNAGKKVEEYTNKAKGMVDEGKKKAGAIKSQLPAGLGKRKFSNVEKVDEEKRREDPNQLTARGILHRMKNTVKKVKQTAKDMFTARGLLGKVSSSLNNAGKKVEEYKNKAKGMVEEGKKKVGAITSQLPGR